MTCEPRTPAIAESYPTFWDDAPPATTIPSVDGVEPKSEEFANRIEEEFPIETHSDAE